MASEEGSGGREHQTTPGCDRGDVGGARTEATEPAASTADSIGGAGGAHTESAEPAASAADGQPNDDPPAAVALSEIAPGKQVEIVGTELNGSIGIVEMYLEQKERWRVQFESGICKNFKADKLRILPPSQQKKFQKKKDRHAEHTCTGTAEAIAKAYEIDAASRPRTTAEPVADFSISEIMARLNTESGKQKPVGGDTSAKPSEGAQQVATPDDVNIAGTRFNHYTALVDHVRELQRRVDGTSGLIEGADSFFLMHLIMFSDKVMGKLKGPVKGFRYAVHPKFPQSKCFMTAYNDGADEPFSIMGIVKEIFNPSTGLRRKRPGEGDQQSDVAMKKQRQDQAAVQRFTQLEAMVSKRTSEVRRWHWKANGFPYTHNSQSNRRSSTGRRAVDGLETNGCRVDSGTQRVASERNEIETGKKRVREELTSQQRSGAETGLQAAHEECGSKRSRGDPNASASGGQGGAARAEGAVASDDTPKPQRKGTACGDTKQMDEVCNGETKTSGPANSGSEGNKQTGAGGLAVGAAEYTKQESDTLTCDGSNESAAGEDGCNTENVAVADGKPKVHAGSHYHQKRLGEMAVYGDSVLQEEGEKTVFVGNLDWSVDKAELYRHFGECPGLKDVRMVTTWNGRSKGMAYIDFEKSEQVEQAVSKLNGRVIRNRAMKVARSNPTQPLWQENTLFVNGIPPAATERDVEAAFAGKGCTAVRMPQGDEGGHKGRAFVEFASEEATKKVLQEHNYAVAGKAGAEGNIAGAITMLGQRVTVVRSIPMKDHKVRLALPRKDLPQRSDQREIVKRRVVEADPVKQAAMYPTTVFVKDLSFEVDEKALRDHFELMGEVSQVLLCRNAHGRPRGFGFVEFADKEHAQASLALSGSELRGREIIVCRSHRAITQKKTQLHIDQGENPTSADADATQAKPMSNSEFRRLLAQQ